MKKIEYNNFKAETIKYKDNIINNSRKSDDTINHLDNSLSLNTIQKFEEGEDEEKKMGEILNEFDKNEDMPLIEGEGKKVVKKIIEFSSSNRGKESPNAKISKDEFES